VDLPRDRSFVVYVEAFGGPDLLRVLLSDRHKGEAEARAQAGFFITPSLEAKGRVFRR
jgi:hypothetical protein